jgi:hypothetical protein
MTHWIPYRPQRPVGTYGSRYVCTYGVCHKDTDICTWIRHGHTTYLPGMVPFQYRQRLNLNRRGICLMFEKGAAGAVGQRCPSCVVRGPLRPGPPATGASCSLPTVIIGTYLVPSRVPGTWYLVLYLVPAYRYQNQPAGRRWAMVTVHHRHDLIPCFSLSVLEVVPATGTNQRALFLSFPLVPFRSVAFHSVSS